MDLIIILHAGVASGTVLLFATIGELFTERSGIINLGVEGMMLIGAMSAYSVALYTGNPWLGVVIAMLAAGCQEKNASSQERKSKLETLEMKNEIKAKNNEIKSQMRLLANCKKQNKSIRETNTDAMIKGRGSTSK